MLTILSIFFVPRKEKKTHPSFLFSSVFTATSAQNLLEIWELIALIPAVVTLLNLNIALNATWCEERPSSRVRKRWGEPEF